MNKKWRLYSNNEEKIEEISEKFNITKLLSTVLVNRNVVDDEEIRVFLDPKRSDFYDPFSLPDMKKAVDRIIKAINNNEKVIIYGDYDVDGITSIAVLKKFLKDRGLDVKEHIPNRLDEGYGLNKEAIEKFANQKYSLIITVDCGISGIDEVEYANKLGMEVIITDHHEPLEILPKATAVVDPKIKNSKYPFNQLAGVGVVFKLIQAIAIKLKLEETEYLKFLDLVCVGTIADIVPLVNENRVIAKLGLKLLEVTRNIGLRALIQSSGYRKIDSNTISFGIAPRINACGRMGHENEALQLFLTENIQEAQDLSDKLNNYNRDRQETEKRILEEALYKIENNGDKEKNVIILGDDSWHHGVIGIVSSKITDTYFKPSILICFEGEIGKGSGRSVSGFDLHNALCKFSEYLEKYGGHEMAVGLSIKKDKFKIFKSEFEKYVDNTNIKELLPIVYIDSIVTNKDITIENIRDLQLLEPFGESNKSPLFLYKNLKIDSIRALTEGKHLKLTLMSEGNIINAIGFNMGSLVDEFRLGDKIDLVGALEINEFNGRESVQINIKDIMKSI